MIETRDVRVDYGDVTAVDALDLNVGAGEIFGLIGPNGAGKTSTIRVLATLMTPTYGDVFIDGVDVEINPGAARLVLGYMPDLPPVYTDLTCREFLHLFAGTYFVDRRVRRRRVDNCLELVSLSFKRDAMAGTLSRGMTQRLVLAKTLLHSPRVLLLDEPASGLDPIARIELRDVLKALRDEGTSILVSSHILTELSDFCDSIGIMERGRMVLSGRIDDIVRSFNERRRMVVEFVPGGESPLPVIEAVPGVHDVVAEGARFRFELDGDDEAAASVLTQLVASGQSIKAFYEDRMDVEDIMLKVGAREIS